LAVDGVIGPQTRSTIRSFQWQKRLRVDGEVGAQTEAALIAAGTNPFPVTLATRWAASSSRGPSLCRVRRAGLDLRYNLKQFSYGHLNVLRVEVLQLLEEAFKILNADDIKQLFGAANAWEVIEDVLRRYFREYINASQRNRMAINGREILRWLAQPHILTQTRAEFEALLLQIAEPAEEWLSSAQALGVAVAARIPKGVRPVVSLPREAVIS
jgi:hypothetical protein